MTTYTVGVHNNGPATAETPTVTDTLPPQLTNPEYSTDGGKTWQPWTGSTTLPNLPNGADAQVLIRGTVDGNAAGTMENTVTTTSPTYDPKTNDNTTTMTSDITQSADLAIVIAADSQLVKPGDTVTYTITVKNNGPATSETPTVSDTTEHPRDSDFWAMSDDAAAPQLINVEYSIDGGVSWKPWGGSATLATMPNGAISQILLRGELPADATNTLLRQVTVSSPTYDPISGNNATFIEIPIIDTSDLTTSVTIDNTAPKAGDKVTYTVSVHNNGPATATSPTVTYNVPSQLTNVEYSTDGGVTWQPWTGSRTLPDIPNGLTSQVLIRGDVSGTATGMLTSQVSVTSNTIDPVTADNSVTTTTAITPTSDLVTTLSIDNLTPKPGDMVTYTVAVHNNGPATATSPEVSYTVPSQITNVEYSTDGGVTWNPWTGSTALSDIPNGADAQVLIRGSIANDMTGTINNRIRARSLMVDPSMSNNMDTAMIKVVDIADIVTTVTIDNQNPRPGDTVIYTISLHNNGPATAASPTVSDTLPPQLTNAEYSTDGGLTWQLFQGSTTLSDLPNGGAAQLLIRAKVTDNAIGTIQNVVNVSSLTEDPALGDNIIITITPVVDTANLVTTLTVDNTNPKPRDIVTYTVTLLNRGPATATNPTINDMLPPQLTNAEYSSDGGLTWQPWTGSIRLPDILSGGGARLMIRGMVDESATGPIINNISTITSTYDPNGADNNVTARIEILSKKCSVGFYSNGCLVKCETVPCGTPVSEIVLTGKYDWVFDGWYKDKCTKCPWDFDTPVTCSMKLYAKWVEAPPKCAAKIVSRLNLREQ